MLPLKICHDAAVWAKKRCRDKDSSKDLAPGFTFHAVKPETCGQWRSQKYSDTSVNVLLVGMTTTHTKHKILFVLLFKPEISQVRVQPGLAWRAVCRNITTYEK